MRGLISLAMAVSAASLLGAADAPTAQPQATRPPASRGELLDRAGKRVETYLTELPTLVTTETMTQHVELPPGRRAEVERRDWVAEVAWVRLSGDDEAIAVRDVLEVDGQPVTAERSRLIDLLHGARQGTWAEARALLDEGARHNLVPGSRNFNLPTVALFFLHPERRERFSWKGQVPRTPNSSSEPFDIEFRERSRPTVIRGAAGEQIYGRGRVWLSADGTVGRTELRLEIERVEYTLVTRFARAREIDLVVPATLEERYESPDGIVVSTATYSNYRRYQTGARLVP
jgi:hypothetical protein